MSHDTVVHHLVRPAMRVLVGTRVTPNHLTALRLATGVGAAAAFAAGSTAWLYGGAGLYAFSMLLDRADGELARQSGTTSMTGARIDVLADCLATMAGFVGLGIGLRDSALGAIAPALGVAAAIAIAVLFGWASRSNPDLRDAGAAWAGCARAADPDDALFLLPPLIWLGGAQIVLVAAGIVAPLGALAVTVTEILGRRAPPDQGRRSVAAWALRLLAGAPVGATSSPPRAPAPDQTRNL